MADLDKDVATFRDQGKLNAANRLENQLAVLKVLQYYVLESVVCISEALVGIYSTKIAKPDIVGTCAYFTLKVVLLQKW